jgi:hypothetical protein
MASRGLSIDVELPARSARPLSALSRRIGAVASASRWEVLRARLQAITTVSACRRTTDGA